MSGPIGYRAFGAWYDDYTDTTLEPALSAAWSALDATLVDQLSDRDLTRIRSTGGRVKSKRRAWRKLQQPRYRDRLTSVDVVPELIDDLAGLRITCVNVRDIEMVQAALDVLPRQPRSKRPSVWLDASSERDYVSNPKESGYRGWHVNLGVTVESDDGTLQSVPCELQVRTLLQDSWGELTHEDTYSKDGALPPLVEVLSRRMADLLATLDDIAEDLRNELDRIDQAAVDDADGGQTIAAATTNEQGEDAAAMLQALWDELDRPVDLAGLAWQLQLEFGAEITDGWFGHGSFKRFLRQAVPDAEISTGRQAYLLPRAAEPEPSVDSSPDESILPGAARQLRRIDRNVPLLGAGQWGQLYRALADAWAELGTTPPSARFVHQLTRRARDLSSAERLAGPDSDEPRPGDAASRRHLDYVARAVVGASDTGVPLSADALRDRFVDQTLQRMVDLRILEVDSRASRAVRQWLHT